MQARLIVAACAGVVAVALMAGQGQQERPQPQTGQPGRQAQPEGVRPAAPGALIGQPDRRDAGRGMEPGEHHKALNWMEGMWTANVKQWQAANTQPREFGGMLRSEWTLDGRFLRNEFTGEKGGESFKGISFIGYNTVKDRYEGVWMDTTTTQLPFSSGHFNQTNNTLTLTGTFADPQSGRDIQTRTVATMESPERWKWEMYFNPETEREFKAMEIEFNKTTGTDPGRPGIRPADRGRPTEPGRPGQTPPGRPDEPGRPPTPGQPPR